MFLKLLEVCPRSIQAAMTSLGGRVVPFAVLAVATLLVVVLAHKTRAPRADL